MGYWLVTIAFFISGLLSAQQPLWFTNGAVVFADYNSIIRVKGTKQTAYNGSFTNHGTTTIDSSYINDAFTNGNGTYRVGLHWVNNGVFISDTSEVILEGDNQLITGDSISKFYDLTLTNTGIKRQTLDARCARFLNLNDRELATDYWYMYVDNPALDAIKRTTGFVSSLGQGRLSRFMMSSGTYLFPTGSSLGTLRYRPVEITPDAPNPLQIAVRLANNEAGSDGYNRSLTDSNVCELNPLFYHLMNRVNGTTNADVAVYYDPLSDGFWDGISYWDQLTPLWRDMSLVTANTFANPLNHNIKNSWTGWSAEPYILSKVRPAIPVIEGLHPVCGGSTELYQLTNPHPGGTYSWNVTPGGTITSGANGTEETILWGAGGTQDSIIVVQTSAIGCSSLPGILPVTVNPQPIAAFSATPTTALGSVPIVFTDSSTNAHTWLWNFGDGFNSALSNPQHIFNEEGTYDVMLVIQTAEGCNDTAFTTITIINGIHIPNVFSPNGDGLNDLFEISGTNFDIYYCGIFNRWGHKVFETDKPQVSWDGRTTTGTMAVEGTYFVVLKIKLLNGDEIEYGGTVNIFY